MSRRSLRRRIESLLKRMEEHEAKVLMEESREVSRNDLFHLLKAER